MNTKARITKYIVTMMLALFIVKVAAYAQSTKLYFPPQGDGNPSTDGWLIWNPDLWQAIQTADSPPGVTPEIFIGFNVTYNGQNNSLIDGLDIGGTAIHMDGDASTVEGVTVISYDEALAAVDAVSPFVQDITTVDCETSINWQNVLAGTIINADLEGSLIMNNPSNVWAKTFNIRAPLDETALRIEEGSDVVGIDFNIFAGGPKGEAVGVEISTDREWAEPFSAVFLTDGSITMDGGRAFLRQALDGNPMSNVELGDINFAGSAKYTVEFDEGQLNIAGDLNLMDVADPTFSFGEGALSNDFTDTSVADGVELTVVDEPGPDAGAPVLDTWGNDTGELEPFLGLDDNPVGGSGSPTDGHFWDLQPLASVWPTSGIFDIEFNVDPFFDNNYCVTYLQAEFHNPADGVVQFGVASDDGYKLWVDGVTVGLRSVGRPVIPGTAEEYYSIELSEGPHTILAKTVEVEGAFGIGIQVLAENDSPIITNNMTANGFLKRALLTTNPIPENRAGVLYWAPDSNEANSIVETDHSLLSSGVPEVTLNLESAPSEIGEVKPVVAGHSIHIVPVNELPKLNTVSD